MNFAAVRSRLETILTGVTFADSKKLRASAYLTEQVNPPQAFFDLERSRGITFGSSTRTHDYTLVIQVLDQYDSPRAAQIRLDQLRDPDNLTVGLEPVLENPANWSGEIHYCEFLSCTAVDVVSVAGVEYLSIEARFGVTA